MNKNIKSIFFVLTLVTLLATVGAVCAADDTDSTIATDTSVSDATVSDTSSDTVAAELSTTTRNDNKVDTKTIVKEDKNIKTATKTVEVNDYNALNRTIFDAMKDADNDEYIINLNEGTYQSTKNQIYKVGIYKPNIIINGNNQVLNASNGRYTRFNTSCNITINDVIYNHPIQNYDNLKLNNVIINRTFTNYLNANLTISNTILNYSIKNDGIININDDVIFGEQFTISGNGEIIINDTERIAPYLTTFNGNYTLTNRTLSSEITNNGNLTLVNCLLNCSVTNNGRLIITDDVNFTDKVIINDNGEIIINDTSKISPYLTKYNGTYTIENITINNQRYNYGNLTIRNSTIKTIYLFSGGQIFNYEDANLTFEQSIISTTVTNNGTITIKNSNLNATIINDGCLIIDDDVILNDPVISGTGEIMINDTTKISPYLQDYYGDYLINNAHITTRKNNYGNLTINNSIITGDSQNYIANHANLTMNNSIINSRIWNNDTVLLLNSTLNNTIDNNNILIITDDCIFDSGLIINNYGEIIINDSSNILPYFTLFNDNYTVENATFNNPITNTGNLTLINSTLGNRLVNNGTLTLKNSTLKYFIENNGCLIIDDDVILEYTCLLIRNGNIIINDTNKLFSIMNKFEEDMTFNDTILNSGYVKTNNANLTMINVTLNQTIQNNANIEYVNSTIIINQINLGTNANTTLTNSLLNAPFTNNGKLICENSILNDTITNSGILIISDDTIIGENFKLNGNGEVIINDTQKIAEFLMIYTGNITLTNKIINTTKTNNGNLTLNNCTITSTIKNNGCIIIDDDTVFGPNAKITGTGEIITNNITKILPYIDAINGNYTITDTTLNKNYTFNGIIVLNNCNITNPNNSNFGTLTLNNCTVDVGEGNNFIDNFGNLIIRKDTEIIGEINNLGGETSYSDAPKVYVVNNKTVSYFFDNTGLTSIVKEGDILDFQGTISGVTGVSFTFNKPINIITTTHDGKINNYTVVNFTKESSGSNVTGLYTYNTQFYVWNANHIVFNNISNVVEDKQVGWGVGQTSIRENSSYITVKNSYFYTKNNGGSSTLVLAWADNCIIENNTIEGDGMIGNMLYITTYNVEIPTGITFNSHNKLINNTIRAGESAAICIGIAYCGMDNLIDGNTITYSGTGIAEQWGSGVDGLIEDESAFNNSDNIICNNKLYGGCGIHSGDIVYNNYMEGQLISTGLTYNNTASKAKISIKSNEFKNNTIYGNLDISDKVNSSKITDNLILGDINIPATASNITITGNNITGTININGSNNIITNNSITTTKNYTITSKKSPRNNTIKDNYLIANTLTGDKSVNLDKKTNTIENNMPYENILIVDTTEFTAGQSATITASIYYGSEVNSTISKGKVTFKVNGKTLKDASGKVIYAKVVNGVATIENYEVPSNWTKEGTIIEAVYSGSTQCGKLTSEKTNITVATPEATLTLTPITSDVQTGSTIILKAKVAAGDKAITTGKIVFKVNGKTVKDTNGKVIYAKVDTNGEASVNYTIPESFKAGTYNIEAVFTASGYEKLTGNTTMTVVKS